MADDRPFALLWPALIAGVGPGSAGFDLLDAPLAVVQRQRQLFRRDHGPRGGELDSARSGRLVRRDGKARLGTLNALLLTQPIHSVPGLAHGESGPLGRDFKIHGMLAERLRFPSRAQGPLHGSPDRSGGALSPGRFGANNEPLKPGSQFRRSGCRNAPCLARHGLLQQPLVQQGVHEPAQHLPAAVLPHQAGHGILPDQCLVSRADHLLAGARIAQVRVNKAGQNQDNDFARRPQKRGGEIAGDERFGGRHRFALFARLD